jgi:sulfate permease, SulP family
MAESKSKGLAKSPHEKLQGFSTKDIASDLSAGLTKSIDSVTGGMANALLAGVNPMYGLYTVLAATPVGALFASSVYMNIDSTGALSAAAGDFLHVVPESDRPAALAVLTLLTGVFMLTAGLLKLGFLTRFISNAVLRGFITGIGLNIILGQLGDITGYASSYSNKVGKAIDTFLHPGQWDYQMLLVGVATIVVVVALDRTRLSKVSMLIALLVGTALVPLLHLITVPLVSSLGAIPSNLPRPILPDLSYVPLMLAPAFSLTIIALAQSAGVSQAYPNPDGEYPNASRDFSGQGAANLATSLIQGLPAGGSLGGTTYLLKLGAKSRWANIIAAGAAAVAILLLGPQIAKIPLAALAALLMVVGYQTINFRGIRLIWRTNPTARVLMIVTFVATLILPLQEAIFFGVALSFAVFAYQESESTTVVEVVTDEGGYPIEKPVPDDLPSDKVTRLNIYGSLFFAGARNLEEDLPGVDQTHNAVVILSLRGYHELGSTFITVLDRYVKALQAHGNTLLLVNVSQSAHEQLLRTEFLSVIGAGNVFLVSAHGETTRQANERAQQLIQAGSNRPQSVTEQIENSN